MNERPRHICPYCGAEHTLEPTDSDELAKCTRCDIYVLWETAHEEFVRMRDETQHMKATH